MMIEDDDLRSLYRSTSEGRLQVLTAGFLQVEGSPLPASLLNLKREAHSLKGDSLVMGLENISVIAKSIEHVAKALSQQEIGWTPSLKACVEQGLQTIHQLVRVATDEDADTDEDANIEHLDVEGLEERFRQAIAESAVANNPGKLIANVSETSTPSETALGLELIDDAELREVYGSTAQARLQLMSQSLHQLFLADPNTAAPNTIDALTILKREAHSLKGDSRAVGVEAVAAFMRQFELLAKQLLAQAPITNVNLLDTVLQDCLLRSLHQAEQIVQAAISAEAEPVDAEASNQLLQLLTKQVADSSATDSPSTDSSAQEKALTQQAEFIEDDELRELYQETSAGRVNRLTSELARLQQTIETLPEQASSVLNVMLQEVHSLKGDAHSIQVDSVVALSQILERSLTDLQQHTLTLTPELNAALHHTLSAIDASIQTATTGEQSSVVIDDVIQNLRSAAAQSKWSEPSSLPAPVSDLQSVDSAPQPVEAETIEDTGHEPLGADAEPVAVSAIADPELRDIYHTTSVERIQRIEVGLVQLEKQPSNDGILAELLRETHSLKGDASSVGLQDIEALSHAMEDILTQIQYPQQPLTTEAGDSLYQGLDAISQLVNEAVTGISAKPVDTPGLLQQLQAIKLASTPVELDPEPADTAQPVAEALPSDTALLAEENSVYTSQATASVERDRSSETTELSETIRVQTRDLDNLAAQTEQLTLTRLQIAETAARLKQLTTLWDDWQTYRNRTQASTTESGRIERHPLERQIDTLMNSLQFAAPESSLKLNTIAQDIEEQVKTLRLLPINNILRQFPRVVRDLSRQQNKSVELLIEGGETTADKKILEGIQDALTHLVRNAIDHGIETIEERLAAGKPAAAQLTIRSYQSVNSFVIEISDDGRGLELEKIKEVVLRRKLLSSDKIASLSSAQVQDLIFTPGFSTRTFTTEISGRGVGLDIVRTQVERLKGNIQIDSEPGKGCTFRLQMSTRLTTANVVMLSVQDVVHALPLDFLQTTLNVAREDITVIEGKATIKWNGQTIPVAELFDVLELASSPSYQPPVNNVLEDPRACVILRVGEELGAFLVDQLLETQEVVFKPQSSVLKRVRNITGATILSNGEVCMILNPPDLIKSLQRENADSILNPLEALQRQKPLILLVEDSPPVRIQEKRLFERAGYDVVVAEDGLEGYQLLIDGQFDAVISDVEMPNLDGLSLTAKIRQNPNYEELPIILVTTLSSEEDRQRGAEAGANAYIPKGKFNQAILLETLSRLI